MELRPAQPIILPGVSDSNNPAHWKPGQLVVYRSNGLPIVSKGPSLPGFLRAQALPSISLNTQLWIESTWAENDRIVYAWYHHERLVCEGTGLSALSAGP